MTGLKLRVLDGVYGVWQLAEGEAHPEPETPGLLSFTTTPDERSVVGLAETAPRGVPTETGWRCIEVAGPLDFEMTGVVASIASPLAEAGVPLFVISTFNTDYVLVKEAALERAISALAGAGHTVLRS